MNLVFVDAASRAWTPEQLHRRTNVLAGLALVLLAAHALVMWRWWSLRTLRRVPPVTATIRAIEDVANADGMGSRKVMTFVYKPATVRGTGELVSATAPVRAIARYETVVGQRIPVHVDPQNPKRILVPESGNPWVPQLVGLAIMDVVLGILFATGSLG